MRINNNNQFVGYILFMYLTFIYFLCGDFIIVNPFLPLLTWNWIKRCYVFYQSSILHTSDEWVKWRSHLSVWLIIAFKSHVFILLCCDFSPLAYTSLNYGSKKLSYSKTQSWFPMAWPLMVNTSDNRWNNHCQSRFRFGGLIKCIRPLKLVKKICL